MSFPLIHTFNIQNRYIFERNISRLWSLEMHYFVFFIESWGMEIFTLNQVDSSEIADSGLRQSSPLY
jgi:hypothetical protein